MRIIENLASNIGISKVYEILSGKLINWTELIIKSLPNILVASFVLLSFWLFSRGARSIVKKLVPKLSLNKALGNLLVSIIGIIVSVVGIFIALEILNLEKTVTSLLAGAGVIGLALGFAFQEIASNFVSGIFIAIKEPYKIGDIVKTKDFFGEIQKINLRTTIIKTFEGLHVVIPNKFLFTEAFTNFTLTPTRRVEIQVGVSYGDDLEKVEQVSKKAVEEIEGRLKNHPVEVFFREFGSSSVNLVVRFWINYPDNNSIFKATNQAIKNIKMSFDQNDITIPFPIRTLDFGIKGGRRISEEL